MKLDDIRFQYVIISDSLLGVEDVTSGDVKVMAEYSIPSDIMHMTMLGDFREIGREQIPPLSAERMSRLFGVEIVAIYLELY
jgi:hypothetical protein